MKLFTSFRDPQGKVILTDDKVWRLIKRAGVVHLKELLCLEKIEKWQREGKFVKTTAATPEEITLFNQHFADYTADEESLFTHPRIDFPSFPYEWTPEMLHDAGKLTLDLAEDLLADNWSIKDATPYNILFQGAQPIFVDVLSFERRAETDPIWLPYAQFVRTFLLPLLVNKEIGVSLNSIFLANRDGIDIADAARFFGKTKKLKPLVFSLVTLPHLLSSRAERDSDLYKPQNLASAERARFILKQSFRRLRRQLAKVLPPSSATTARQQQSNWTAYTQHNQETLPDYMQAKQMFVTEIVGELQPKNILDVGCNTGLFSFSAAAAAQTDTKVVAIDHDPAVISQVYQTAVRENLNILPLVVNLSRPTPRLGWRYSENPSFLDRAIGHFDLVMMLAVIHHLLVQERIPLREIFRLASDLTKDVLICEFVPPTDKFFKRLARGREHLHQDLTAEEFTRTAGEFFNIVRSQQLPQTERRIYLMRKK